MSTFYIGIDVSQKTLDVAYSKGQSIQSVRFSNDASGFAGLKALIGGLESAVVHGVMEATGPYYLPLATSLWESGILVSVVNPLKVKYFCRMQFKRTKTDRQDAKALLEYGYNQQPACWAPPALYMQALGQMQALLDQYIKQRTALKNQMHAQKASGLKNEAVRASAQKILDTLEAEIQSLEQQMEDLANTHHKDQLEVVQSIPGVGRKTAIVLTLITHGFTRFDSAKQLASFVGICPRLFDSGTTVRGKNAICKMGMSRVRQLLYLCAMQAIKVNPPCKELYQRLLQNGKPKMKALIAVAHKLLRQALAVAKSQKAFSANFGVKPCI